MPTILTVTLNPSLDLSTSVAQVRAGEKLRCSAPLVHAGGGGVNVARAVRLMGGAAHALVAVGGAAGQELLAILAAEGVEASSVTVSGTTRSNFAVMEDASGAQYRFGFPGAEMTPADAAALLAAITTAAPEGGFVVVSGSLPPGLPDDFHRQIHAAIAPNRAKLVVDTSGAALLNLLQAPPAGLYLLRVDELEETGAATALNHAKSDDGFGFAASLVQRGVAEIVMSGHGKAGSIMVTKDAHLFCAAPDVPVRSKIGAGDAFLAGVVLALARGESLERALEVGVAAASATVMTEGTELCRPEDVARLMPECKITRAKPERPD
jgi:6-phosphofructokinase 2